MTSMPHYSQSPYMAQMPMPSHPMPALPHSHSTRITRQQYDHPPNVSSQGWTEAEDRRLLEAKKRGLQWSAICEQYFPGKTGNACRKRHERILQKNRAGWPEEKVERLATLYMENREQFWSLLAQNLGEPRWDKVEAMVSGTPHFKETHHNT